MKTLVFGAGPLGSLYAHLLYRAGADVTIVARGQRYEFIQANGAVLVDEYTKERIVSSIPVVDAVPHGESYDLVIVLIRKNKLHPVIEILSRNQHIKNILFMGNNVTGFDYYTDALSPEKILFGFPGAGGSVRDQVVHFVDREKPGAKRLPVVIGEMDGIMRNRTRRIMTLFHESGIPVDVIKDMDGWLKYHAAFVLPIVYVLYKHACDTHAAAKDDDAVRMLIRACKEGGDVLGKLGFKKRYPFKYNFFYWLPEFVTAGILRKMFDSRFAEVAFGLHAKAGVDEMAELSSDFETLIDHASLPTPSIDRLKCYLEEYRGISGAR
jgi:2-dehydropantoate 2-reductase